MIYLRRQQIETLINYRDAAPTIAQAYRDASNGLITLPPVGHIAFADVGGDCHIKYGYKTGASHFVIKIATGFSANSLKGLPTGNGVLLVLSAHTGELSAILHDEMLLTDVRTGLGGAIASKQLAKANASRLLVVGSGPQARQQIRAHEAVFDRPLSVTVWARQKDKAHEVAEDVADIVEVTVADNLARVCDDADIIVTATGATAFLIRNEWIREGVHVTAIGADAPGKQELEPALLHRARVIATDKREQCQDHGELSHVPTLHDDTTRIVELGSLLDGHAVGRQSDDDITIADLTGIAAQDIAIAEYLLSTADGQSSVT